MIRWIAQHVRPQHRQASLPRLQDTKDWPPPDVGDFIVSFPKSGRTWLRTLLGAALSQQAGVDVMQQLPSWLGGDCVDLAGTPVLFTHGLAQRIERSAAEMRRFAEHLGSHRRLLMIRDPRDTIVSYYFQRTRRPFRSDPADLPRNLSAFLRDPRVGIDRLLDFLVVWAEAAEQSGPFLCITYEHLHRDPQACLSQALHFFGVTNVEPSVIQAAVEFSAFRNMRRMEVADPHTRSKKLRAYDLSDERSYKTRKGKVGSYAEDMSPEDIAYVEERIAERLPDLMGYRTAGEPPSPEAISIP